MDRSPQRKILGPDQIDDLARAVLSLTQEVWVLKDRVFTLEAVLEQHGTSVQSAIETYKPDESTEARLKDERERLFQTIVAAMGAIPSPAEDKLV